MPLNNRIQILSMTKATQSENYRESLTIRFYFQLYLQAIIFLCKFLLTISEKIDQLTEKKDLFLFDCFFSQQIYTIQTLFTRKFFVIFRKHSLTSQSLQILSIAYYRFFWWISSNVSPSFQYRDVTKDSSNFRVRQGTSGVYPNIGNPAPNIENYILNWNLNIKNIRNFVFMVND